MDYIRELDIRLEREMYYAGEVVQGVVVLDTLENFKLRAIRVVLRGRAHAEWKVVVSGDRRTVRDDQYLVDDRATIWGKDRAGEQGVVPVLPRGQHSFPFRFQLPESSLPCSFESKAGQIRYYIKVTVDIPYASPPQGMKYFTVIGPYIDCMEDQFLKPMVGHDKKAACCAQLSVLCRICCCCCGPMLTCCGRQSRRHQHQLHQPPPSADDADPEQPPSNNHNPAAAAAATANNNAASSTNPNNTNNSSQHQNNPLPASLPSSSQVLSLRSQLERTAYCCGESIKFRADVCSGAATCWLRIRLVQYVEYFIDRGVLGVNKDVQRVVLDLRGEPVAPGARSRFVDTERRLVVPPCPPTVVGVCRLIQIYYVLKVSVETEANKPGQDELSMHFPITVATVPFRIPNHHAAAAGGAPSSPTITYEVAADHVEGGNYIGPEFQLGQVYDGGVGSETSDAPVVLYRPVYVVVKQPQAQAQQQQQHQHREKPRVTVSSAPAPDDSEQSKSVDVGAASDASGVKEEPEGSRKSLSNGATSSKSSSAGAAAAAAATKHQC